jgi:ATP-binding cassette subfamily B (MDR/TAP) protein 1
MKTNIAIIERLRFNFQTIGSHDIKNVNLSHTRSQLGLVGQEPRLFNCTIQENICYGLIGDEKPTQEQMEEAAKQANIHNFIITLPMVGH